MDATSGVLATSGYLGTQIHKVGDAFEGDAVQVDGPLRFSCCQVANYE
jgi:hypothetical protein